MAKLKRKPSRELKRGRNADRRAKGLTARGARPTYLSPVEKVLLGGGLLRSLRPIGADDDGRRSR